MTSHLERLSTAGCLAAAAGLWLSACIARGEGLLQRIVDEEDAGAASIRFVTDAGAPEDFEVPPTDPHGVRGVEPTHGPFSGGQRALVRGAGFGSDVRVWFGDREVAARDVVAVDARRAQVVVPAGSAGPVDITVQNGDDESTRRTLEDGYEYDRFFLEPPNGPVSGGTIVTLFGDSTDWTEETVVLVDLEPCEVLEVRTPPGEPQELDCRTPRGTPGAKAVRVASGDQTVDVLDAFLYVDSDNGFRGGLSGEPIEAELRVIALDGFTGIAIPTAMAIAGDVIDEEHARSVDENGVVVFQGPELGQTQTVTVTAPCYMPITFVDVPVDTVTAYLDPILSPECLPEGDPPRVGGSPRAGSTITGQLVWRGGIEFRRAGWINVPLPASADARRAAYVFDLERSPTRAFRLPSSGSAITPDSEGTVGYEFRVSAPAGNVTLYALAGIENRQLDPPLFTAYAMGLVRGIPTEPGTTTDEVFVMMETRLDHAIELSVDGPKPTSRGPDRITATVAVRVGDLGYAVFPFGRRSALLPTTAPLGFVGLPPLVGSLFGAHYVMTARADTGQSGSPPRSVIGQLATTLSGQAIALGGFVEIPQLLVPAENTPWNGTELSVGAEAGGASTDLTVIEVQSGGGLSTWVIAAPLGAEERIRLPDLSELPGMGPRPGPVSIEISRARIEDFDYGSLRYAQLGTRGWDAHATDVYQAHYDPP